MNQYTIEQTLDAIRKARGSRLTSMTDPRFAMLFKDANSTFSQSGSPTSGLTFYDLEPGAKFLYPVLTPLRNMLPRASGKGGIEADWRSITAVNATNVSVGVSGGNRGAVQAITTKNNTASYKGIGLEGNVDFEAQYAGQTAFDVRAINTKTLLEALMIGEEQILVGGFGSQHLNGGAATPTPTATDAATGGTLLHNQSYSIICVALTLDAFFSGGVNANGVRGAVTRTNADSSSDTYGGGAGKVSGNVLHTTAASPTADTYTITASVTPVLGAAAYAWYIATAAGSERIVAITGPATVTITALPAGTNQLATALGANDNSQNSLVFDGLITQAITSGSNAYTKAISATLTGDSAGGVVEIDAALQDRWDNFRLSFTDIWANSQQILDISKKILANGSSGAQRFVFQTSQDMIRGGVVAKTYLNKFTSEELDLHIHPYLPPGTILFTRKSAPYPLSNVGDVMRVLTRQEYFQIEWPLRSRKYEHGVYADEVLQHYFPPSLGVLYDVRAG
jgi:hypothetical protein